MGKYRRYKNKIEMFLSSERGKRVLNFCYSWGASIVVIGAMFKIVHLPYANQILCMSLIFEAVVFFISAFERPVSDYNWEEVFPVLKSKNPLDRPDFGKEGISGGGGVVIGGMVAEGGTAVAGGEGGGGTVIIGNIPQGGTVAGGTVVIGGGGGGTAAPMPRPTPEQTADAGLKTMGLNVSEEDAQTLAASIKKLGEAAEQIAKMADMTDATRSYVEQITTVAQNLERFNVVTLSLSEVSDSLVNSCKAISGTQNEENPEDMTPGYVQQMGQLNDNLSGLNKFYETQLNGLRSQMDTIHHINAGLSRIRDMYDSSVVDSSAFRAENERMAQLLGQLNQVYSRLLQAMTVNANLSGMPYPPQQPPYQGGYHQPPYSGPIR
ncbi:MAG: gliding motility protein GldL [Tannerella sp.]|jgi:gliding motility-associated protein GldL|nr:gliding motility protein GldL [Tannerella sp.]